MAFSSSDSFFSANPPGVTGILAQARVFVAGAGGLGSNLATMLVRAGVGRLVIADFDVVTASNLNRQAYLRRHLGRLKVEALRELLLEINPEVEVECLPVKLTRDNFAAVIPAEIDLVCECFDHPGNKAALTRYMRAQRPQVPYTAVSGLAGAGPVEELKVIRASAGFYVIGDQHTVADPDNGTLSSRVMAAAAMEAHCGIRMLLEAAANKSAG